MSKDPLDTMQEDLQKLKKDLEKSRNKAAGEGGGTVFFGVLTGLAYAADWTFFGGLGTVISAMSGYAFLHYKGKSRRLNKEVRMLETAVFEIQKQRALNPAVFEQKLLENAELKNSFNEAQQRIKQLEAEVQKLQKSADADQPIFKKRGGPDAE